MIPGFLAIRHRFKAGMSTIARRVIASFLVGVGVAGLVWIAAAYLHPELRKAIIFSGFGLC